MDEQLDSGCQSTLFSPLQSRLILGTEEMTRTCIVRLDSGESLMLCGYGKLEMVSGSISVLGFVLTPQHAKVEIFSPGGYALLSISCAKDNTQVKFTQGDEFWTHLVDHILSPPFWIPTLENMVPLVPNLNAIVSNTSATIGLEIPPQWKSVVDNLMHHVQTSYYLLGAKGVGKSTFMRYLVNRLLNIASHVGVLDLDIGQTEFSPPGTVSLHFVDSPLLGPPFTHMKDPAVCEFVGTCSPSDNPQAYVKACARLVSSPKCQTSFPLIINTMGWLTGLGEELARSLLYLVQPTHVLVFSDMLDRDRAGEQVQYLIHGPRLFGNSSSLAQMPEIIPIESKTRTVARSPKILARDLRFLCLSKYFCRGPVFRPLCFETPYFVRFDSLLSPKSRYELQTLDCSVVGLCKKGRGESAFLGLGFVRDIDFSQSFLLVVCPENLADPPNLIVRSAIHVSPQEFSDKYVSVVSSDGSSMHGELARSTRHNLERAKH